MAAIVQTEGNRAQRRAAKKQKRGGVNVYHYQNRRTVGFATHCRTKWTRHLVLLS